MDTTIHRQQLPSGLTCYVIPKKGYVEKQAALAIHYGSADIAFTRPGGERMETPPGVAHFLEHKLFEEEDINIFEQFTRQGAFVNAFTDFMNTAYYFNTIERFEENLSLLFRFVGHPYFTDENVEKEKGIIVQEINMYEDDPNWRLYISLYRALFHQSPVRHDIAGTVESINGIQKDLLYRCYETFYTPANMALVCVGDLDASEVSALVEQLDQSAGSSELVTRDYGLEPQQAMNALTETAMPVSIPMFQLGYKAVYDNMKGAPMGRTISASRVLTDIVAGESSSVYAALYQDGFIDNTFSAAYIGGTFFGSSLFAGSGSSPRRVEEAVLREVDRLKKDGIPQERFDIVKRKHIGRYLQGLNNIDQITALQIDLHSKGLDVFSLLDCYYALTKNDVEERLHSHLCEENHALSVVWPA